MKDKLKQIKICSKTANVRILSNVPSFHYNFEQADVPVLVDEAHSEKILKNPNFYITDKELPKPKKVSKKAPIKQKTWSEELNDIKELKGIDKKENINEILKVYPNKELLLKDLVDKKELPFSDKVNLLLNKTFIH